MIFVIKIDIKQFIQDRLWCGWWYDAVPTRGSAHWRFERHPAVRLISIMKLKKARRLAYEHNHNLNWDSRKDPINYD